MGIGDSSEVQPLVLEVVDVVHQHCAVEGHIEGEDIVLEHELVLNIRDPQTTHVVSEGVIDDGGILDKLDSQELEHWEVVALKGERGCVLYVYHLDVGVVEHKLELLFNVVEC